MFVVCTANDVSRLPPEFGRSERFDGIFFLDLPGRSEKDAIWRIYRDQFEISPDQRQPDDTNWTGAEIRALLPVGVAARCAADGSGSERGTGRGHGGRVGRQAADVGQRPVPDRRASGDLSAGRGDERNAAAGESR